MYRRYPHKAKIVISKETDNGTSVPKVVNREIEINGKYEPAGQNRTRSNGNYKDRTGNLRSSTSYIILHNRKVIDNNFVGTPEGISKKKQFSTNERII